MRLLANHGGVAKTAFLSNPVSSRNGAGFLDRLVLRSTTAAKRMIPRSSFCQIQCVPRAIARDERMVEPGESVISPYAKNHG